MKKKTDRELINNILERLRLLENWYHRIEHEKNVFEMGHRISRILCDKGDKFDLELLAKLQVLLGTNLIEVKSVNPESLERGLKVKGKVKKKANK